MWFEFRIAGIKPTQQIYAHCGGGIAASVPFFAAKVMLNYPNVKLYKESQLEWLRDDCGLPFWTYDAPNMMREKQWLSGWNRPMVRMFGASKINLIDVRPADAYKQGHIPYAVNIPAAVFQQQLTTPANLAGVLAAHGVNPAFETVIVSGGGVNISSALAYLLLEKLGQKKLSLLMESVDDWATSGAAFTLAKEATVIGAATSPKELAVPATFYPANLRADVVISPPTASVGAYPKIYIASGKNIPASMADGKVIHLPYSELLNPDGTPKPAKDIWNILVKAGLPRYAEIICVADEPGDAAANYFVLKLMGYPDVKVMVA